ncbi:MAG: peptide chain release factor N(5)-glutamine methyltransferase [Paludibacteraceae bacterium]|nr:peptide chain release factor N(5)-glutamine methyltransferase [Paludibacteraceae bacterium]
MKNSRNTFYNLNKGLYSADECGILWRRSVSEICGIPPEKTYFIEDSDLSPDDKNRLETTAQRLAKGEPLEYILGFAEFCSLRFNVNKSVLIPRLETQEMVDFIGRNRDRDKAWRILDIGTGSGCIAIAIAKLFTNANVTAIDISPEALETARSNAILHKVDNVDFLLCDFLNDSSLIPGAFDIIVSNPPYVRPSETDTMPNRVLNFEPHAALFVPEDNPLLFYRHIAAFSKERLNPGGLVMVEINQYLGNETSEVFKAMDFDCKLKKDTFLENRFIYFCI